MNIIENPIDYLPLLKSKKILNIGLIYRVRIQKQHGIQIVKLL